VLAFVFERNHGKLKSRLIRAILGGSTREDIAALTRRFLDAKGTGLFHAKALAALESHRARGDYLVILSASTDNYVPAIGARLGVDEVISTVLLWNGDRLDGALASPNRRGAEKTRCVEELRARHPGARFAAYGNAGSDIDHLRLVEDGLLVNASTADRARAEAVGLPTADWR